MNYVIALLKGLMIKHTSHLHCSQRKKRGVWRCFLVTLKYCLATFHI